MPNTQLLQVFRTLAIVVATGMICLSAGAASNRGITYQGILTDPSTGTAYSGSQSVVFKILDPSGNCILWQEAQTINIDASGRFSTVIGLGTNSAMGAATFQQIFINAGNVPALNCGTYTPGAYDEDRLLTVVVNGVTLAPSIAIKAMPFASQAEQISGYGIMNLAKLSTSNANTMTGLQFDFLTNLAAPASATATPCANNDVLKFVGGIWTCAADATGGAPGAASYASQGIVQFDTNAATSGITVTAGLASVNAGTAGGVGDANKIAKLNASGQLPAAMVPNFDASNISTGTLPVLRGGTGSATALTNNKIMISSGGNIVESGTITANKALVSNASGLPVASTVTDTELGYVSGATANLQTQINTKIGSSGWTNNSVITANAGGTLTALGGSTTGSHLEYTASGPAWTTAVYPSSTTANQLLFSSSTNVIGGLPSVANSVLTTDGSGVPSWTTPPASSQWTTSASDIYYTNGNVGIGTTSPGARLDVKGAIRMSGSSSGYAGFQPAPVAGSTVWTLPTSDGSAGTVLSTNGSGTLSWITPMTPSLSNGNIWVGNGSNVATAAAPSGAVSMTNTGAFSLNANSVNDANITNVTSPGKIAITTVSSGTGISVAGVTGVTAKGISVGSVSSGTGIDIAASGSGIGLNVASSAPFDDAVDIANTGGGTALYVSQGLTSVQSLESTQFLGLGGGGPSAPLYTKSGSTTQGMYFPSNNWISFSTTSTARMTIDNTGNVGVGTTNPVDPLSIGTAVNASATHASLNLSNTALASGSPSGTYLGANPAAFTGNFMDLQVGGVSKFKVDSAGNLGVGTGSPAAKLDVNGSIYLSASSPTISTVDNLTIASGSGFVLTLSAGSTSVSISSLGLKIGTSAGLSKISNMGICSGTTGTTLVGTVTSTAPISGTITTCTIPVGANVNCSPSASPTTTTCFWRAEISAANTIAITLLNTNTGSCYASNPSWKCQVSW